MEGGIRVCCFVVCVFSLQASIRARTDSNSLFESDHESVQSFASSNDSGEANPVTDDRKYFLNVEDELLVLMKLRLRLSNTDLSVRLNVSQGTVSKLSTTWINYLSVNTVVYIFTFW